MKEINNEFKNTFDKIKLDDKIINNNMNKILYRNNKNKLTLSLSLRYAVVLILALVITVSGSVYVIANKTNNPIKDVSDKTKIKLNLNMEPVDKRISKNDITKSKYTYSEAEDLFGVKLLKLKDGADYVLKYYGNYNNDNLRLATLSYQYKYNEVSKDTSIYNIMYLHAYITYEEFDNKTGFETTKKDYETYYVESNNKDITATVLYSAEIPIQVMFIYKNVYYKFIFNYNLKEENLTDEDRKTILNYIQDALDNKLVEEI